MGNRAVITIRDGSGLASAESDKIGVYLHWNGGRDSVEAFLIYCKLRQFRTPEYDNYGWARLCQVICNFMGGDLSVGIDKCSKLDCDNGDNGVYLIENWEIVGRECFDGIEQDRYDLEEFLNEIDVAQPKNDRLGADAIRDYMEKKE